MLSENNNHEERDHREKDHGTMIRLTDIVVAHDRQKVLPGVSLTVDRGDFLAISGPNGGGKTTLLRVMLKLLKPDSGSVEYFWEGRPEKRLHFGYLPQKSNIDVRFPITVEEVVKSGLLRGWRHRATAEEMERLGEIVDLTGIGGYLDRNIGDLSGGQLQRTLLGRALISRPEVLMLDEPLSYVDKEFEHQIYSIMERIAERSTIVLVSHEMSVISRMATRHIIVDHGVRECERHHHGAFFDCE